MNNPLLTISRIFFLAILLIATFFFVGKIQQKNWLETDLTALLPQQQAWSAVQLQADLVQTEQLNRQLVALVGHQDPQRAFDITQQIQQKWQTSELFSQVFFQIQPDIAQLQQDIQQLKPATLPEKVRWELRENPQTYFQTYAEQIANPFDQTNLLSLDQDWLGFGRFVLAQSQQLSQMQWNAENGVIFTENSRKTWVLLRAELKNGGILNAEQRLLALFDESQQMAQAQQAEWKATGSALFAAQSKLQAESESTLMSVLGISLTLLLLLMVFRSLRTLWLFLPIFIGMAMGVAVTVLALGKIHILTLVIGTSLVGVLIDFPLHWLASSLARPNWNGKKAMQDHQSTFLISLAVTLLGYGLLWFTDLPVLKQTALFSAVALFVAILATLLFLPALFVNADFSHRPRLTEYAWIKKIQMLMQGLPRKGSIYAIFKTAVIALIAMGVWRSNWQDDIRQWVAMPPQMLQQAQEIGQLTGIDLGSQYFLVVAENDESLLEKTAKISKKLTALHQPHQALSQWLMSEKEQKQFYQTLGQGIQPSDYQALLELGLSPEIIQQQIEQLNQQSSLSLQQALNTRFGDGWKSLYLGELLPNQVVGMIKILNMNPDNSEKLQAMANQQDIFWQDKRGYLNQAFQQTRNQAGWLKVLSFALAGLLLLGFFGWQKTLRMLAIPMVAIVVTVAIFGWLGLPITLFTMFGLLLVSAIGIDYTAYMQNAKEPRETKITAMLLASMTTMISFCLLAISSTPAVASFGLSVSLGVSICVGLAIVKLSTVVSPKN